MADGFDPNAMANAMAQWAAQMNRQLGGGSGMSPLLGAISAALARDVQITSFKNPGGICNADNMIMKLPQPGRPGLIASLVKQIGCGRADILEGLKKCDVKVQQASITDITGQGSISSGGSFAASVSGSGLGSDGGNGIA